MHSDEGVRPARASGLDNAPAGPRGHRVDSLAAVRDQSAERPVHQTRETRVLPDRPTGIDTGLRVAGLD